MKPHPEDNLMSTSMLDRELLHVTAPVAILVDEGGVQADGTIKIKGFASVEAPDRSGDVVPPEEFRIEQFMAAPAVLVNHDYWRDSCGNYVGVGRPLEMFTARLGNDDDPEQWAVIDIQSNRKVHTYPKKNVPNLKKGDRGLFVVVEVTEPQVAARVARGELSAFSWRGMTTIDYRVKKDSSGVERVLTDIDLYEISLTNIPDNPSSTFIVGKAAYSVRLSKSRFETVGMAEEYLKAHRLDCTHVQDDGHYFHARQSGHNRIDSSKLVVTKMANGVDVVAGPLMPSKVWTEKALDSHESEKLIGLLNSQGNSDMTTAADAPKTAPGTDPAAAKEVAKTTEAPKVDPPEAPAPAPSQEAVLAGLVSGISQKTAEAVASAIAPLFQSLTESMTQSFTKMTEKMAAPAPAPAAQSTSTESKQPEAPKEEVAKTAPDSVLSALNTLAAGLEATQKQLADTQKAVVEVAKSAVKTAETVAKTTPKATVRDEPTEKTEVSKSAAKDKNSVFDSVFPFLYEE